MTTVGNLMIELSRYPAGLHVVMVIDDSSGGQIVCSGDIHVGMGNTDLEIQLEGENDE